MKTLLAILTILLLTGCVTMQHQQTYTQAAPTKYPPTTRLMVFEYRDVSIRELYELLYSDFMIIGRSEFNGPYEDPLRSVEFARSIGTDIFVATSQFKDSQTSFVTTFMPISSTSHISGYNGTGPFYGTVTTFGTRTTVIPTRIDRYEQNGFFLRNVNNVTPLWERKIADYKETAPDPLSGVWYNENTELKVFKSGTQMVAFFVKSPAGKEMGRNDELKMVFSPETGTGVYLMQDRTPQPARIKLNKFGHLEATLISQNDTFSYARR